MLRILIIGLLLMLAQENPTPIDDFEAYDDLASKWWMYADNTGSTFNVALDNDMVHSGEASLRLDLELVTMGYAGIGFDYSFNHDWQLGQGIILQVRGNKADMPLSVVLYLDDPTQTSPASPGITPFSCAFDSEEPDTWHTITLPWSCFQRLTWIGTEGLMEFTPNPVSKFEIAIASRGLPVSGNVWIDDIRVISDENLNRVPEVKELFADIPAIQASQIGYRPQDAKWFVSRTAADNFTIFGEDGEAFAAKLTYWGYDTDAEQEVYRGDFSGLTEAGTYRIVLETGEESYPFTIAEDVYRQPLWLAARVFYLQRSGITINDAEISGVTLDAGHLQPALLWDDPEAEPVDVSGGWYDAGDYGRYLPSAAFSVNQLLYGFEANPDFFADGSLDIPESGNGLPDLLDEIRWELDWMLKMQREDGAVHHKVTTREFPGYGALPAEDAGQLYVFGISSQDTSYFAAVMAQAARTFEAYDAEYAAVLLKAAEKAWAWLEANPEQVPPGGFKNPPVSDYPMQGGYDFLGDEAMPRLWAAAELFNTTGSSAYETAFFTYFDGTDDYHSMSWFNSYPMAYYAYLTAENATPENRAAVEAIFLAQAQRIYDVAMSTGYTVALTDQQEGFKYVWGSNQAALAHGLYLMLANNLAPNEDYEWLALAQVHYVLGANPLAKAYISGIGSNPVEHIHHNASYRTQRTFPGFITEGANSQDAGGDAPLQGLWDIGAPPALRYTDHWESWASNEATIYANASFVALLAHWAE